MRGQGGLPDERAFSVLFVLPLRNRSCIFATLSHQEETIAAVRSSSSGGVVERRVQGRVNK